MADNIQVTPGAGVQVAADDVGGVLYQRVKLAHGPDGSATDASADAPFPVTLAPLGGVDDAAAAADGTGSISILAALRRMLLNGASLLSRLPSALVNGRLATQDAAFDPIGEKIVVGTAKEKFFSSFWDFDTTNDWELVQTGAGQSINGPFGGNAVGVTPYIAITSGTTAGAVTVILSRISFRAPVELRYQISSSARIANNSLRIGFVEVDETTGAILTDTTYATAPSARNARNAALQEWSGTAATTGTMLTRSAGSAVDTLAAGFGSGYTTVATGTSPNFIAATTFTLSLERDGVTARGELPNVQTNAGLQFVMDRVVPNPNKLYKLAIIVENGATAPASSIEWRVHLINLLDATRFDTSPRHAGSADASRGQPVNVLNSPAVALASGQTLANVTTAGTPAVPATAYFVNSAASTNAALVLTGTSGVQAFFASNAGASDAFVKLFNKATAPVVGTDVPEMVIRVPAGGQVELTPGFNGYRFALGLGIAITGGAADTDATAVAAGQVKVKLSRTV